MHRFHFPIVIIDEDFRSENTSGLGIRALAQAIEKEGFEVIGVTSYGDLSQFAQQQSRASAFILSIDDEEFLTGLIAIAVPVKDARGQTFAAVACHAPLARIDLDGLMRAMPKLQQAARKIARTFDIGADDRDES